MEVVEIREQNLQYSVPESSMNYGSELAYLAGTDNAQSSCSEVISVDKLESTATTKGETQVASSDQDSFHSKQQNSSASSPILQYLASRLEGDGLLASNLEQPLKAAAPGKVASAIEIARFVGYLNDYFDKSEGCKTTSRTICPAALKLLACGETESSKESSGDSPKSDLVQAEFKIGQNSAICAVKPFIKKDIFRNLDHSLSNVRINKQKTKTLVKESEVKPFPKKEYQKTVASSTKCQSSMLIIKGAGSANVTIQNLCNLCSNYGNVEAGLMNIEKKYSLIKFTSHEGALLAKKHLNKFSLGGTKLSVILSSQELDLKGQNSPHCQIYVPNVSCRRFKHEIPAHANPISRTLHVCIFFNHKRRMVRDGEVLQLISEHCSPIRIQRDSNKDNLNMWFVEFFGIAQATQVLMRCHDLAFEDGNLRISFTKTKRN